MEYVLVIPHHKTGSTGSMVVLRGMEQCKVVSPPVRLSLGFAHSLQDEMVFGVT
jgi:hypothetical protein